MAIGTPMLGWDRRQFVINLTFMPIKSLVFWGYGHGT